VLLGFQDSAATAHFTRRADGTWRVVHTGVPVTSSPPKHQPTGTVRPAVANPTQIAAIAENNVGVSDTPASTDWSLDCNPYTTMDGVGVSTSGCDVDPTFGVQNENEEWCADFTKWVWGQGGATSDFGVLDPAAASFYTWGQDQGESMPTDPPTSTSGRGRPTSGVPANSGSSSPRASQSPPPAAATCWPTVPSRTPRAAGTGSCEVTR
jgi:hypothetical protein